MSSHCEALKGCGLAERYSQRGSGLGSPARCASLRDPISDLGSQHHQGLAAEPDSKGSAGHPPVLLVLDRLSEAQILQLLPFPTFSSPQRISMETVRIDLQGSTLVCGCQVL